MAGRVVVPASTLTRDVQTCDSVWDHQPSTLSPVCLVKDDTTVTKGLMGGAGGKIVKVNC